MNHGGLPAPSAVEETRLQVRNDRARLSSPPPRYRAGLALPRDVHVKWLAQPERGIVFVHAFVRSRAELKPLLADLRSRIDPAGAIWISRPKKAAKVPTDLSEDEIRGLALPLGLVDIKVCAVDEIWSGLKLVVRKSRRPQK